MKKRILGILILTLVALLALPGATLAWDNEDILVADNSDFWAASGYVEGSWSPAEIHFGGESRWPDNYNVYQDIGSGSGLYGTVIVTDKWADWDPDWYTEGGYYFATTANGWNSPPPPPRPPAPTKPDWYPAPWQFAVYADGVHYYDFVDRGTKELPAIELMGTIQWSGQAYKFSLSIPGGTILTGENVLRIIVKDSTLTMVAYSGGGIAFSNPVMLTEIP